MTTTNKNVCSYAAITGKNAKSVDALIAEAVKSAKTMREKVQVAAVAVLIHAEKHGDWTKARDLVNGMGAGVQSKALVKWFVEFGGLTIGKVEVDGKDVETFDGWNGKEYIKANFQKAKVTAWYTFAKVEPYKGFNFDEELKKLLARADKAMQKVTTAIETGDEDAERLKEVVNIDLDKLRAVAEIAKGNKAA